MSSVSNDQIRHRILENLYKTEQERPGDTGVDRKRLQEMLQVTNEKMDFNVLYLKEKGLIELHKVYGVPWHTARITAVGIDVIENKNEYAARFPFIQTTIQEIHGNVYGPAVQAVGSKVSFVQQLYDAFQQARGITEMKTGIEKSLREEVMRYLNSLEKELKKEELDAGKLQALWKWLKRNANWVVPTLTQVVVEGLRRAVV